MVRVVWPSFHIQFRKTGVEDHHNLRMPQGGSCLGSQHQRLMGCLWCILALSRSRNENWERILKYVNNCKHVYIHIGRYIFVNEIHWNPFSKQEGWVMVYITMKVLLFSLPCFLNYRSNTSIRWGFVTWSWRMELLPCFTRQVGGWTCCAGNQNLSQSMGCWLGSLNVNTLTCPI